MVDSNVLQKYEITEEDIRNTPPRVLSFLTAQAEEIAALKKRLEELEAKLNRNSSNSSKPPSSDEPFKKKAAGAKNGKAGGKPGHTGHRQALLPPDKTEEVKPEVCSSCGSRDFSDLSMYYTHQFLELPKIKPEVTHFVLYKGPCSCCGKVNKGVVPRENRTGYGPNLSAVIAEIAGNQGDSRSTVQTFCSSVLGFHISLGAIQKVIDRASAAISSHYDAIAEKARDARVNHLDETSWFKSGVLSWLWVMAGSAVALFMIHSNRSMEAFKSLVKDWEGILVSDGYGVYRKWVGERQTCLAHLIRDARALSQRADPEIARFGKWAMSELQRLTHMASETPTVGEWRTFYARLLHLIARNHERKDAAGTFARRLEREIDNLWVFLVEHGVSPTNNHAERMLRYAVLWRKRSQGTSSDKGNRWVERILSLRQTCRLQSKSTFHVLSDALRCHFKGEQPDLTGGHRHSLCPPVITYNRGAPGIDGMTIEEFPAFARDHWPEVLESLMAGTYQPSPVRRVEIPKPTGGLRPLGIPRILDRLIQQAISQVLTPIFDPTFSESSFGFRPGRSAHDAVYQARRYIQEGYTTAVDMDLSKFFDTVRHDVLMHRLARKVRDKRVLRLIGKYLRAGVMIEGRLQETRMGVPQGGPLSPLLSNVVLDDLDKELEKRGHRFARYADDCAPRRRRKESQA